LIYTREREVHLIFLKQWEVSPQMANIPVGVVGVGYFGQFHAEKYACMEGVELVGVVDQDRSRADAVAQKLSVPAFYRIEDLLGQVDAVSIVTPTPSHFDVGKAFLEHDAHLFIEKPISRTLTEADKLIQMAAEMGKIIQVGHVERFNPAFRALPSDGPEPSFIEARRIDVFKARALDVSVIIDLMIHDLDLVLSRVKAPVAKMMVNGAAVITPYVDIANARLIFEGGCVANITASRIGFAQTRKFLIFNGTGYHTIDFVMRELVSARRDPGVVDGPVPGMMVSRKEVGQADTLKTELRSFINAVGAGSRPVVSGSDGRNVLDLALAIEAEIVRTMAPPKDAPSEAGV